MPELTCRAGAFGARLAGDQDFRMEMSPERSVWPSPFGSARRNGGTSRVFVGWWVSPCTAAPLSWRIEAGMAVDFRRSSARRDFHGEPT